MPLIRKAIVSIVSAVSGQACRFCGGLMINARCNSCRQLTTGYFRHPRHDARELAREPITVRDQHGNTLVCA